ncbi:MAG: GNAT family N-acetyltransferase [Actinobacteria bacterium]|nr:GNAT family N-acetyltransferase [Actinomycetota bacterium]
MTGPDVRIATTEDGPAIAAVQVAAWNATYRGLLPDHVIDQMRVEDRGPQWAGRIGAGTTVLLAVEDGRVAGFCALAASDEEGAGEVTAMYARPDARGRGHGRRMMAGALEWFRSEGFGTAVLWVLDTNRIGREFYEKAGWVPDGASKVDEVFGEPVHHVRYRIDLTTGG